MSLAGRPPPGTSLPAALARLAGGRPLRPVWRNELGGITAAIGRTHYLKWSPPGAPDLEAERTRLTWIAATAPDLPVPRVVSHGRVPEGQWMLTTAVPGTSAVAPRRRADPAVAAAAIGAGLRVLHETLPVRDCPFDGSARARVARARRNGHLDPDDWSPEHRHLTRDDALARLDRPPSVDRLVVCHGDACAPNTLLDAAGRWSGHVDFGDLGVGDRWADLAVATWSLDWNFGTGWQDVLLSAYGVGADPERIAYYRLLWDLSP